jgi:hypothetical protein
LYQKSSLCPSWISEFGNARIAKHLSGIPEMWDMVGSYDGTDNAETCVLLSRQTAKKIKIDKVTVYLEDAINLDKWKKKYDLIIITWLRLATFIPIILILKAINPSENGLSLSRNEKFSYIFKFVSVVERCRRNVISACYIDNDEPD